MSADAQWIIGIGLPIIMLLIGVVWAFLRKESTATNADISKLETRFEQWTKDKEKFDYDFRHDEYGPAIDGINSKLLPLVSQATTTEKRVDELKDWKHEIVDAYIPRAVDEHERRLNRLDLKVFNGHKSG